MTMLRPTSRIVAMNKALSDLSLRAIVRLSSPLQPGRESSETLPGYGIRIAVSGQQSSVGPGPRHQLPWPGQPGFPAASPPPHGPTDDCSQLTACESGNWIIG